MSRLSSPIEATIYQTKHMLHTTGVVWSSIFCLSLSVCNNQRGIRGFTCGMAQSAYSLC